MKIPRSPLKDTMDTISQLTQDLKMNLTTEIQQVKINQQEYVEKMEKLKAEN